MDDEKSEWLSHVHVAAADGSDSFQLTQGDKSATHPRWSPDGKWIAFLSARGGEKEKTSLYRIRVAGGEAERLSHEKSNVTTFEWAPDGKAIAFAMPDPQTDDEEKAAKEKRDARVIDADEKLARLYVIPVEKVDGKRALKKLTTGTVHVTGLDWAPDSSTIVFSHQKTPKVFDQNDISVVAVSAHESCGAKSPRSYRCGRIRPGLLAGRPLRGLFRERQPADLGIHWLGPRRRGWRRISACSGKDIRRAAVDTRLVSGRPFAVPCRKFMERSAGCRPFR